MLGEPFRGIVLPAHQAGLERKILERTLLGAGGRSALQAKDEYESGQWNLLSCDAGRANSARSILPIVQRSASSYWHSRPSRSTPRRMTIRRQPGPIM